MSTLTRIITALAVLGAGVCAVYWLGREVPSEAYRVRHPQGYSVCHPKGWSAEIEYARTDEELGKARRLDGLSMIPDHFTGEPPKLFVNRLSKAPDQDMLRADGWSDGLFQGQPALVREKKVTRGLSRGAVFQRAGQWFEVVEGLSVPGSVEEEVWWQFLETFRYPDGELPTTEPARITPLSAPATTAPFRFPTLGQ